MQFYKLVSFTDNGSIRHFDFWRTAIDAEPMIVTVAADLVLTRKYKLPLQDLPTICSRMLMTLGDAVPPRALILSESAMSVHAQAAAAAAEEEAAKRVLRAQQCASAARAAKRTEVPS